MKNKLYICVFIYIYTRKYTCLVKYPGKVLGMETWVRADQLRNRSSDRSRGKVSFIPPSVQKGTGAPQSPLFERSRSAFFGFKRTSTPLQCRGQETMGALFPPPPTLTFMACPGTTLLYSCKFSSAE